MKTINNIVFILFFAAFIVIISSCEKEEDQRPEPVKMDSVVIKLNANTYDTYECEITWNDKIRKIQFNEGSTMTYLVFKDSVLFNIKMTKITAKDQKFSTHLIVGNAGYTVVNSIALRFKAVKRKVVKL